MNLELFTIGHSTHAPEKLLALLSRHEITAVADVRSSPYSRYNPQFNKEALERLLRDAKIAYVFLGRELGARPADLSCYDNGKVRFDLLAQTGLFQEGLDRLRKGMHSHRICLLCAEKDPISCHRTILVCRNISGPGVTIRHILEDGELEDHEKAGQRLMAVLKVPEYVLFAEPSSQLAKAYDIQAEKIAFVDKGEDAAAEQGANER